MINLKKHNEIKNSLRRMADFYGLRNDARLEAYAEELNDQNIKHVILACKESITVFDTFPSLNRFMSLIRRIKLSDSVFPDTIDPQIESKFKNEEKKVLDIEHWFFKNIGESKLNDFIKFWLKNVYGIGVISALTEQNIGLELFKKPALLDLCDSKFNIKKSTELGREKLHAVKWVNENPGMNVSLIKDSMDAILIRYKNKGPKNINP